MPELPEVEVLRRDLEKEVVGKKIKSVEVTGARSVRRHKNKKDFIGLLEGHKVASVQRRGKYLVFRLDGAEALVVHLGMSGQLLRAKTAREKAPKHTHVVITFTQGGLLRFVDPRTFGEMFVTTTGELENEVPELAHLGFDALEQAMSWITFGEMLRCHSRGLKSLLMDQRVLAGIGNIYSDEILFEAGLRHDRPSDSLSAQEVRRLYRAMVETLQDAIKHRGSSISDEQYRDLFGDVGEFQTLHKVYEREGMRCRRCRSTIVRQKYNGRSTYFCPRCQV